MIRELRPALLVFALLTLVTGVVYPGSSRVVGQLAFPSQANGSLIERDGRAVGSRLLGQPFSSAAVLLEPAVGDGADALQRRRVERLEPGAAESRAGSRRSRSASRRCAPPIPATTAPVPVDLVTASGSGLDPHISPAAAEYQVARVARARDLPAERSRGSSCASTRRAARSAFSASRASMCSS